MINNGFRAFLFLELPNLVPQYLDSNSGVFFSLLISNFASTCFNVGVYVKILSNSVLYCLINYLKPAHLYSVWGVSSRIFIQMPFQFFKIIYFPSKLKV